MKELTTSVILAIIISNFPSLVAANSGPVFWYGHPSSDIVSIKNDSPIKVENENLIFDFSNSDKFSHTINGKVTATYQMFNPTDKLQSVQMAFPFVGSINNFSADDIVITADNSIVLYDLYIGDVVNSYEDPLQVDKDVSFDFNNIVNAITNDPYKSKLLTDKEKGKLYTIEVKPTTDERINFVIDFNYDSKKTKVLTKGFNSYGYDGETTEISAWCFEPMILEFFVLGDDFDLNINGYTDGGRKQETKLFNYRISSNEVEVKAYLMDGVKKDTNELYAGLISDTQLYNLYARALDVYSTRNMGYISWYDLLEQANYDRIISLVYTVEFPPNSKKEVSVNYRTSGTMAKTKTVKPLYTFDYIFNPAKNWSDFKNLNIKIIAPEQAPHIISSNIKLIKEGNSVYVASFNHLPEDDLSFTLYENEEITAKDKLEGNLQNRFLYFIPFVIGIFALLIGGIISVAKRRHE